MTAPSTRTSPARLPAPKLIRRRVERAEQQWAGLNRAVIIPEVGFYVQQRNLSCEYAAVYMATAAWGSGISNTPLRQRSAGRTTRTKGIAAT